MIPQPHIRYLDRVRDGVVIEFDDGTTALFSESFLYRNVSQAKELIKAALEIVSGNADAGSGRTAD